RVRSHLKTATQGIPATPSPWTREFWVPHRMEVIRIAAGDIDLIEAERDYMRLHVGARSFLLHQTITELERRLNPAEFVRLHRSTLARRDRIVGFKHNGSGAWEAQLRDGRWLRVGRTYLANARAMAGPST
ncbi:MAG TPA: LytTR family DNA-binding domain-containing protein, partial [Rhizomicrobium sp.]|nr:LytTR family DNA-binding domain-containing protein [Rhizomicrobium sp.]